MELVMLVVELVIQVEVEGELDVVQLEVETLLQ